MPEQPHNLNENILNEAQRSEGEKTGAGLELVKSPEVTGITNNLEKIEDALVHDQPVTSGDLESLEKNFENIKVDFWGETMTLEDARNNQVRMNAEIMAGNYSNHFKLTYIPARIAEILSGYKGALSLNCLTTLSDVAAEHLSQHKAELYLNSLITLSDKAAEYLSHHERWLQFNGLTTLSDVASEHLSHRKGRISLNGLTTLSDTAAEHLSHHEGDLWLQGLTTLSDVATEYLSHHEGNLYLSDEVEAQVEKFKNK